MSADESSSAGANVDWEAIGFAQLELETLSPEMRRLMDALLLYKSMFVGPWFAALIKEEDPVTRATYDRIRSETNEEAKRAVELLRRWGATATTDTSLVTKAVLNRLLADMLALKKSSTEVFLAAGLESPTEEMRREFLQLADVDRRHAEELRKAIRETPAWSRDEEDEHGARGEASAVRAVQSGPFPRGQLTERIRTAIENAQKSGHRPTRLILSPLALRHLRDEGSVQKDHGDIFGIATDVEFSWEGEAFTFVSASRLSPAEIVTEMRSGEAGRGRTQ